MLKAGIKARQCGPCDSLNRWGSLMYSLHTTPSLPKLQNAKIHQEFPGIYWMLQEYPKKTSGISKVIPGVSRNLGKNPRDSSGNIGES